MVVMEGVSVRCCRQEAGTQNGRESHCAQTKRGSTWALAETVPHHNSPLNTYNGQVSIVHFQGFYHVASHLPDQMVAPILCAVLL